jgi:hypothetical protein
MELAAATPSSASFTGFLLCFAMAHALQQAPRALGAAVAAMALGMPIGAWANPKPHQEGSAPALYATQAEAAKAAKEHFHCSGAHRMGNQWMPCSSHGAGHTQH